MDDIENFFAFPCSDQRRGGGRCGKLRRRRGSGNHGMRGGQPIDIVRQIFQRIERRAALPATHPALFRGELRGGDSEDGFTMGAESVHGDRASFHAVFQAPSILTPDNRTHSSRSARGSMTNQRR